MDLLYMNNREMSKLYPTIKELCYNLEQLDGMMKDHEAKVTVQKWCVDRDLSAAAIIFPTDCIAPSLFSFRLDILQKMQPTDSLSDVSSFCARRNTVLDHTARLMHCFTPTHTSIAHVLFCHCRNKLLRRTTN